MAGDFPNLDLVTTSQWVEPDHIHPVIRSWLPAYSITLTVVATLILTARIWSHSRTSVGGLGLDDLFISSAWVFATLFTAACLLGTLKHGFDRHVWDVESTHYTHAALIQWLSEGAFTLSICFTKISVLCFYRRLDPPCTKSFRRILYVFIASTACYLLASLLTQLLICQPIAAYWAVPKPDALGRTCTSQRVYYPVHGSLGVFSTFYTIAIPYSVLRNVPMSKVQRNGLRAIMGMSLVVIGAGIARTIFLFRLADSQNGDATWNGFNVFVCAQLECHFALICACLPFLQRCVSQDPSLPIIYYSDSSKDRKASVVSRVSSSLSDQFRRLPLKRGASPRNLEASRSRPPVAVEIPEWEFQTLGSPQHASSPVDEISYEQYVQGRFGPPAPPKDSRDLFDQYRRERGHIG